MTQAIKSQTGKGALLAVGAAALILAGCASSGSSNTASSEAKVHCAGLNSCKGTSDCKTAENACKGHNVCKGHGFLSMTKAECDAKGGKII
jgi:outer membrane murein-binding lipoprotein Lpp